MIFRIPPFIMMIVSLCALVFTLSGQTLPPIAPEDPAHNELRKLRDDLIAAVGAGNIDGMISRMAPDVVITWQDGQVCRGPSEVKAFYERMAAKSKKTFQGYKIPPTADALTTLYANNTTGVVYGKSTGRYYLMGQEIELANRWTATVVKINGQWLLASYHVSMNVLDNPLLNSTKKIGLIAAGVSLILGCTIGWVLARRSAA